MISPARPRSTASGLQMTRVRSHEREQASRLRRRPADRRGPAPKGAARAPVRGASVADQPVRPGLAHHVQRAARRPRSSGRGPVDGHGDRLGTESATAASIPSPARPRPPPRRAGPAASGARRRPPSGRRPQQRVEHGRRVASLRACPTTASGLTVGGELLGQRCGPAPSCPPVVGPVHHHQRVAARPPRADPGTAPRPRPRSTTSSSRGAPKNASAAARAHAALSPWWAPCRGTSTSP